MKRRSVRRRSFNPETLEPRHLLAAGPLLHTHYIDQSNGNTVDKLAVVNATTGDIETIANMQGFAQGDERMADIAFGPDGRLYGITRDWLYEIHPVTAQLTQLGRHDIEFANALTHDRNGRLLAMNRTSSEVFRLNVVGDSLNSTTTFATLSGFEEGEGIAGDITFQGSQMVVATTNERLVWYAFDVNPDRPRAVAEIDLTELGLSELFGLAVYDDTLYATDDDSVIRFDLSNPNFPSANIVAIDEAFGALRGAAHYAEADGPVPIGTLSGVKWDDVNGDGVQQLNEQPLCDWDFYIDENLNGVLDPGEPVDRTDSLGRYHFFGRAPGLYTVDEIIDDARWVQTSPQVEHRHLVGDYTFEANTAANDLPHDGGLPDMTPSFVSFGGGNASFTDSRSFLDMPVPLGADPFTIAIDASYSTNIGTELYMVSQQSAAVGEEVDFELTAAAITRETVAKFCDAGGSCTEVGQGSIEIGRHQYAITWDGTNVGIFVDDTLQTESVSGVLPDIDGGSVRFGDPFDAAVRASLQGPVHGIRIYNNALTQTELINAFIQIPRPTAYSVYLDDVVGLGTLDFGNRIRVTPAGPEIEIREGAANGEEIASGDTLELGSTVVGNELSSLLFIVNLGDDPLEIENVNVTGGFEVDLEPLTIDDGESTSFTVTLTDTTEGIKQGQISIDNSDDDEDPYVIDLLASVVAVDGRPRELIVNTTAGDLVRVNKATGATETLMDSLPGINDIAHHPTEDLLVGIGSTFLFELDTNANTATPLFAHGLTNQTALAFSPLGELFSAGSDVHKIDLQTESTSQFATGAPGAAGDLAFLGTDMLLSNSRDQLYRVEGGRSTLIGDSATSLNGLAAVDLDTLYGFATRDVFTVDTSDGSLGPLFSLPFISIEGATYQPPGERDPLDVDGNGVVIASDALLIINELNGRVVSDPVTGQLNEPISDAAAALDVDDNQRVLPSDLLLVINRLNGV